MVLRDPFTGWTASEWGEFRMWCSMTGIIVGAMFFLNFVGFLDIFRLLLFASPAWLTILIAPCQGDRNVCKLVMFSVAVFLGSWFCVHAYPSQCRHAWGTMMISDTTFWRNETEEARAILQEKDSYYILSTITAEERGIFWPKKALLDPPANREMDAHSSIEQALKIIRKEKDTDDKSLRQSPRIKKWIEAWSGGLSLDILLLRSYCNIHQRDRSVPHVYPLRVLGVLPNQAQWTAPCPYWSCLLTEARPQGKLVFITTIGACAVLTYVYYRFDCAGGHLIRWWTGAGSPRLFWWWFWAALLPLMLVLLIKTTYDEELAIVITQRWHGLFDPIVAYASESNSHKFEVFAVIAAAGVAWAYRQRLRVALGLDEYQFFTSLFVRDEVHEDLRHGFQVCIWRVEVNSDLQSGAQAGPEHAEEGHPDDEESDEQPSRLRDSRSLGIFESSPIGRHGRSWFTKLYAPMFRRQEDSATLSTPDGRVPTLSVNFQYGLDEVQGTRDVKPLPDEWWSHDPVYFQENFKISVVWRPHMTFRCEVRDTSAALGHVSLGSVAFDEPALERQFQLSRKATPQVRRHSVPVMQIVQQNALPPTSAALEQVQINQLKNLGFEKHRLSDGGAVWLAFCELDHASSLDDMSCW